MVSYEETKQNGLQCVKMQFLALAGPELLSAQRALSEQFLRDRSLSAAAAGLLSSQYSGAPHSLPRPDNPQHVHNHNHIHQHIGGPHYPSSLGNGPLPPSASLPLVRTMHYDQAKFSSMSILAKVERVETEKYNLMFFNDYTAPPLCFLHFLDAVLYTIRSSRTFSCFCSGHSLPAYV